MRKVILEERSWSADDNDTSTTEQRDRRTSEDPVTAAGVDYGYARI